VNPNKAPDMFYLPEKQFAAVKAKLLKGSKITNKEVDDLVNAKLPNHEMYIPVDMNGAGENLDDFEDALKKLGAKKAAGCFVAARTYFEKNKDTFFAGKKCPAPITAQEWKTMNDDEDDDDDDVKPSRLRDFFYVPEKIFADLRQKLATGKPISREEADSLVNAELADNEMYVPVDMQGTPEDLDDFEDALNSLGAKKILECFIQAMEHFDKTKHELSDDTLPKPITSKEWKKKSDEDSDAECEEEDGDNNEDEDSSAEGDEDDEEGADEPAAKKAKSN